MYIPHKQRTQLQAVGTQFLLGLAGLALITFVCFRFDFGVARTGFAYVILIALVSLLGSFSVSVVLSIVAIAGLNYFFARPLFDLRVDDWDDVVRMAAFLTTSLVVTALTARLKRTGDELRDSKAGLEAAQRIAHVGWWERDLINGHVSLSDEVRRIFGVQPVGLPHWHARWLELIHPEDRPRVAEAAAAALVRGGPRYDVEYRVVRPDGHLRTVRSQGDVTWDDSGRPLGQFGVLQDITELRQAEQELRANEARFRTFVDYATDAFFLLDDQSTVLDFNRQACESLGYGREELIGKHRSDLDAGLDDAAIESLKQRVVSGEAVTFETRHKRKDGTSFPVEVRVGQFDKDGRRLLCLVRDITERKRAEDELRASEARFRTFVDYAIDGFFLLDINSIVLDVNRQGCENLGYSREELIGQHRSLFDPDLDQVSIAQLAQHRFTGETVTFESHHRRKDGTSFPVEVRVRAFEQGGRRFLALVRDIMERKRAEDKLRQSEERFRTLVQFSFDVYWETDAQHRFTRQLFAEGLADAPASGSEVGKTRWEVPYLEPDDEAWRKHRRTLDAHLPFRDFELARPTPNGGKRYVSVSGLPMFDESGRFIGYRGVGRHITERKEAEEALRRSEAYLAEAQRLSNAGAFAFNEKESLYWSEGTFRLWGFDPLEGVPSAEARWQRVHPDDRGGVKRRLLRENPMSIRPGIVGAFILGATGVGVAGILFFGGTRMFSETRHAVAYFSESVAGLEVGAPVTFHGVRIGQVKNVALEFSAETMSARIPVVLEFQPEQITWEGGKRLAEDAKDFERLVRAGLRAQLQMQSFVTGQVRVDLDFQPETPMRLTGASTQLPEIPTVPSELGQFLAQLSKLRLQDLAESATGAFASLDRFLKHADTLLDPLAGNANDALVAARQTFRTGDDAIAHLKEEASTALHDLDALLVDVRHQVGPRSAELSRTLTSAERAARQAGNLLDSLNGLAQPRSQFRGNLEAAIRDIATAAGSLRDFAATVERNPNALLLGRSSR